MRSPKGKILSLFLLSALGTSASVAQSGNSALALNGRWDANLTNNGPTVPFRLDISGSGPTLKGTFYDCCVSWVQSPCTMVFLSWG